MIPRLGTDAVHSVQRQEDFDIVGRHHALGRDKNPQMRLGDRAGNFLPAPLEREARFGDHVPTGLLPEVESPVEAVQQGGRMGCARSSRSRISNPVLQSRQAMNRSSPAWVASIRWKSEP